MKHLFIVLATLLLASPVYAFKNGLPVKTFKRTYTNLKNLDLGECEKNYRFLNDNWMDCEFKLPEGNQVSPAHYPVLNYTINVGLGDVTAYIDIRTVARTFDEASLGTTVWVTAYYRKAGDNSIHMLPKKNYSPEIFKSLLKSAFTRSDADGSMTAEMMGVPNTSPENQMTKDIPGEQIYIGARNVVPNLNECEKVYEVVLNDRWPDDGAWSSSCFIKEGTPRDLMPLSKDYWTERLNRFKKSEIITIEGKESPSILFQFLSGHYSIFVGTEDSYEVAIPFADAKNWIKEAITKLGTHQVIFTIKQSDLKLLQRNEEILGKMVLKNGKVDWEKTSKL